jgi:hypothetical protein
MDSHAVIQRFETERQALAVMDHPNIARVFDGGLLPNGRPFFAMELVNGLPLVKFCDDKRLGTRDRLHIFAKVCQAVQHAHQKGVIHRDLKPANVLVTMIDGQPEPKVIDFGVAKAIGGKLHEQAETTQFGAIIGTLEYMPPEQAGFGGKDIDTRADIYALGVILYELLTGVRPFDAERLRHAALDEVIRMIREEEPSKPSTRLSSLGSLPSSAALRGMEPHRLIGSLRGDLDWIAMKCLEKDRNRRYATAQDLGADVIRHLNDEPVLASPPSTVYLLRKFVKKHRTGVAAIAAVLAALATGIAMAAYGLVRAEAGRRDAEHARDQLKTQLVETAKARDRAAQLRDQQHQLLQRQATLILHRPEFKNQEFQALRRDLYATVLAGYQEQIASADQQTTARQLARIGSLLASATLMYDNQDVANGRNALLHGIQNAEAFMQVNPNSTEGAIVLLRAYNLGTKYDGEHAGEYIEKAKRLLPTLAPVPDAIHEVFYTYFNEAVTALGDGQNRHGAEVAAAAMRNLVPILEAAAKRTKDDSQTSNLVMALRMSASAADSLTRPEEADAFRRRALDLAERRARQHPRDLVSAHQVAEICLDRGDAFGSVEVKRGDTVEYPKARDADREYRRAAEILERVLENISAIDGPALLSHILLTETYRRLAIVSEYFKEAEQAETFSLRAAETMEHLVWLRPENAGYWERLGNHLGDAIVSAVRRKSLDVVAKHLPRARRAVERTAQLDPNSPGLSELRKKIQQGETALLQAVPSLKKK